MFKANNHDMQADMNKLNQTDETYDMYSAEHQRLSKKTLWWEVLKFPYTEQMFTAFALALIVGYILQSFPQVVATVFVPLQSICLVLFKIIVVPLMVMSILSTILSVKLKAGVGKLVSASFVYFLLTTLAAVVVSLVLAVMMEEVYPFFDNVGHLPVVESKGTMMERIGNVFLDTLFSAVTSGSVLLFISIAFLLGFLVLPFYLKNKSVQEVVGRMDKLIRKVLMLFWKIAPLGMFFFFTPAVASYGGQLVGTYASLIGACYMCYLVHAFLVYLPSVYLWGGINPLRFIAGMVRPLMFAMASQSSIVTIPYGIKATDKMGVRKEVNRLVLPLGATFNMDGSAIYMVVASIFVAACYGIHLTLGQYLAIGIMSVLLSFCVVGVPGGSLVLLPLIFAATGIPMEGVVMVACVDKVIDWGRTMISVTGDSAAALVLDKWMK